MEVESGHVEAMLPLAGCIIMHPRGLRVSLLCTYSMAFTSRQTYGVSMSTLFLGALFWFARAQPMTARRGIDTPAAFHCRHGLLTVRAGSSISKLTRLLACPG